MSEEINLKQIERKAYRAFFEDGLTDVQLGGTLALISIVPLLESWKIKLPLGYLAAFLLLFGMWSGVKALKTHVVFPRLGTAVFSPQRHKRTKQARSALAIMVAVTMGLVVLTASGVMQSVFGEWSPYLFIGAVFVVSLSLLAFFLDYPRLYAYGWFLAFMDPFSARMETATGWVFPSGATVFGGVIVLIGAATFIRFLNRYPQPPQTAV